MPTRATFRPWPYDGVDEIRLVPVALQARIFFAASVFHAIGLHAAPVLGGQLDGIVVAPAGDRRLPMASRSVSSENA